MRILFFVLFTFLSQSLFAQVEKESTDKFVITGRVKTERVFSIADLQTFPLTELENINTSCSPKIEKRVKSLKGILLRKVLDSVAFVDNKSALNQYYFLFVASDGYKIVFSYNEIFNTNTGNNLYLVTEMEGRKITEMEHSILLLVTSDIKSGTRNMKWLSKIVVCKAE